MGVRACCACVHMCMHVWVCVRVRACMCFPNLCSWRVRRRAYPTVAGAAGELGAGGRGAGDADLGPRLCLAAPAF